MTCNYNVSECLIKLVTGERKKYLHTYAYDDDSDDSQTPQYAHCWLCACNASPLSEVLCTRAVLPPTPTLNGRASGVERKVPNKETRLARTRHDATRRYAACLPRLDTRLKLEHARL